MQANVNGYQKIAAVGLVATGLAVNWPFCGTLAHAAGGADTIFTVGNYPVEARAKDAVTAKNTALADGQQAALRSLLRRIVPVTAYARLRQMPPVKAADIVNGVSVRSERNSTTDYIATLDFSFQPQGVRDILRRNQIPFVDVPAPQTVLVPLYRAGADAAFENGAGFWYDAWKGLDLTHTVAPLKLEPLKVGVTVETVQSLAKGTNGADRIVSGEYGNQRVIMAIAEPDATGKKLTVTLAGTDAVGTFSLVRHYRLSGGDKAYTAELAAVVGLGVLEGRWKAGKGGAVGGVDISGAGADAIQIIVEFANLAQWNDIRSRLLDADGAFDVAIGSVSARSAEVSLRHPGGALGLNQSLAGHGLTMSQNGAAWLVRSTF